MINVCECVCVCVHAVYSVVSDSLTVDCSCQALLSMGFFRQEYCSGLLFPPPGNLPDPGIEPTSPTFPAW